MVEAAIQREVDCVDYFSHRIVRIPSSIRVILHGRKAGRGESPGAKGRAGNFSCERPAGLTSRVRSMLLAHGKRLLHPRIGKEFHANLALDRPIHYTLQVAPSGYLFRWDPDL